MLTITALLHTENDALRLGRCLETLYPCDQIVVVDHGSRDATVRLALAYGARVTTAAPGEDPAHYVQSADLQSADLQSADPGWIFCLDPHESVSESLAASLYEWKLGAGDALPAPAFSVFLREETEQGWVEVPVAQTRLIPRGWNRWDGRLPQTDPSALALSGELLRFVFP